MNIKINNIILNENLNLDYNNTKFAIIRRKSFNGGLFYFYNHYLGCIEEFIKNGYVPIVDLKSFPNIFNKFNINLLIENPWEIYFSQPYGYKLEIVKRKAKNIKYFECENYKRPNTSTIFINKVLIDFWNHMANKYIPINKNIIIKNANNIWENLFQKSNNVLGILLRGTDYITIRPKNHCIPPKIKNVFNDIDKMKRKNKYDYIFLTTEDDIIRNKFINKYKNNLKYIKTIKNINYNYKKKEILVYNKNINGNVNFMKLYLINIIILSKCIDILCARTNGSIGAFILTKGFRYTKAYYLGKYK